MLVQPQFIQETELQAYDLPQPGELKNIVLIGNALESALSPVAESATDYWKALEPPTEDEPAPKLKP